MKFKHISIKLFFLCFILLVISCKQEIKHEIKQENKNETNHTPTPIQEIKADTIIPTIPIINQSNDSIVLTHAKGFTIEKHDTYTQIDIISPWPNAQKKFTYILHPKGTQQPSIDQQAIYITTPIDRYIVTSTTDIPILEYLGIENNLVGFPHTDYISSEKTRALVKQGNIKNIGKEQDINTEIVLELAPELIIGFSTSGENRTYQALQNSGIPTIFNGSWTEEHPLGRVEWIKLLAAFFNKEKEANQIFETIKQDYNAAKDIVANTTEQPTVISGNLFKDVWYVPGGKSYIATFLKDAKASYLWADNPKKGSLTLSFEEVLDKGQKAQIWIDSGSYKSLDLMLKHNDRYELFDAFKNKSVYSPVLKIGPSGGLLYYELGSIRPDLILKDLIKIIHPELVPEYQPYFFKKLD